MFAPLPIVPADLHYVDASLVCERALAGWHFLDADGDGVDELFLATAADDGSRTLTRFDLVGRRYVEQPATPAPAEAFAWTFADGAPVFLIPSMVPDGIFRSPQPDRLAYWNYVVERPDGDEILLPTTNALHLLCRDDERGVWAVTRSIPIPDGTSAHRPKEDTRRAGDAQRERREVEARLGRSFEGDVRPFLGSAAYMHDALLESERRVQAPALVDWNGDGSTDLLHWCDDHVDVWLARDDALPSEPTRTEALPAYLAPSNRPASLRFADLDGRPPLDLLAVWGDRADVMENAPWRVMVLLGSPDRLFPEAPQQVLRFSAGEIRIGTADVDGDGALDLSVRQLEWPSALEALTGPKFHYTHMLFRGGTRRGFERRPTLRRTDVHDTSGVRVVLAGRDLTHDCTGDGIADLVEVALDGTLAIRQVERRTTFLGGTRWRIDDEPTRTLAETGSIEQLEVRDLNGDGFGDPVSASGRTLHIFLSVRR